MPRNMVWKRMPGAIPITDRRSDSQMLHPSRQVRNMRKKAKRVTLRETMPMILYPFILGIVSNTNVLILKFSRERNYRLIR